MQYLFPPFFLAPMFVCLYASIALLAGELHADSHFPFALITATTRLVSFSKLVLFVCLRRLAGKEAKETPLIQFLQLPRHILPSH